MRNDPKGSAGTSINGLVFRNLGEVRRTLPTGDGLTAWAVSSSNLAIVDVHGNILRKVSFPHDIWHVGNSNFDYALIPGTADTAWLFLKDHVVHLRTSGAARDFELGANKKFLGLDTPSDAEHEHTIAPDGKTIWVRPLGSSSSQVSSFLESGSDFFSTLPVTEHGSVSILGGSKGAPDNTHAWFGAQYYTLKAGGKDRRVAWMFLADRESKVIDVSANFHRDINTAKGVFPSGGKYWCVPSEVKGVYCVRQDGTRLSPGGTLLSGIAVRKLVLPENGPGVYVIPKGEGLLWFNPDDDSKPHVIFPKGNVIRLLPTRAGTVAIGRTDSFLVRGDLVKALPRAAPWAKFRGATLSNNGHFWWLETPGGEIWSMDSSGVLANGAKPVRDTEPKSAGASEEDPADDEDDGTPNFGRRNFSKRVVAFGVEDALAPRNDGVAHVGPNGHLTILTLPSGDKIKGNPQVSKDGTHAWIQMEGRLAVVNDKGAVFSGDLRRSALVDYGQPILADDGKHAWTTGGWVLGGAWALNVLEEKSDLTKAAVWLSEGLLRFNAKLDAIHPGGSILPIDPEGKKWSYELDWKGREHSTSGGTVQVSISSGGNEIAKATFAEEDTAPSNSKQRVPFDSSSQIKLRYTDEVGSRIEITWPSVVFSVPVWRRPVFLTFCWFGVVSLICASLVWQRSRVPLARDWVPLLVWSGSGISTAGGWLTGLLGIEPRLMLALLVCGFGAATVSGMYSTRIFKELAQVEPFRRVAPLLLTRFSIRRRFYADYLGSVERSIRAARKSAYDETYVAIPALVRSPAGAESQAIEPARSVADFLSSVASNMSVLIAAPGGRGKSALVREAVRLLVERFPQAPSQPLPVFCEWKEEYAKLTPAETLKALVTTALGRNLLIPDALDAQLRSGDYVVVIDGLNDVSFPSGLLAAWAASEYGSATRFLLATRPDVKYERALAAAEYSLITPLRLDDTTISSFEQRYVEADSKYVDRKPGPLSTELRKACRTADGTYLPILVRLAVGLGGEAKSIRDVYELTVSRLLKSSDGTRDASLSDATGQFCLDTYWKTGRRITRWEGSEQPRQELLEKLFKAGLIVAADEGPSLFRDHPQQVRFFHDSIQSFLTARALDNKIRATDDWQVLAEAAGHPRFVKAQSDLLIQGGSELFQFCVHQFDPEQLIEKLSNQIGRWATDYDRDLRKNEVAAGVPASLRETFEAQLREEDSPGKALLLALTVCSNGADRLGGVVTLFGRMAPIVWPQIESKDLTQAKPA